MSDDATTVIRNDEKNRYDLHVGDVAAGFAAFERDDQGRLVFDHTVVDKAFGGRGLGKTLAAEALADVARRGETVVPECPFIVKFLRENEVAGLRVDWRDEDAADAASAQPSA
ncbi:GNAT family N-acetyltransferase [Microbacterium sp. NM3R9]|uniref:GNAT family N-acetyltransferase n=1 Tax=Microbacterium thalli TaxID=3027921 RepID=UPI002366ACB6|nr:GNAT family N-acetyltransferase [Microbacterium thalli]MDN8547910.1 GNAT family N-acetyltransferase [Microbacterium thalli]